MGTEGAWDDVGTRIGAGMTLRGGNMYGDSIQHRDGNEHSTRTGMGTGITQARGGDIMGVGSEVGTGMIEVGTSMGVKMEWERGWECRS